jgi:hypothetical protein
MTEQLHHAREAHSEAEELGGIGMPQTMGMDALRKIECADESIESMPKTVHGKSTPVRCADEELHRFPGVGIDGRRSATTLVSNDPDELNGLWVDGQEPFVVQLAQRDADGIALSGPSNQALTFQTGHLPRSHAGPASQEQAFGPEIVLSLKSLLESRVEFGRQRFWKLAIEWRQIASSQKVVGRDPGPLPLKDVLEEASTAKDVQASGGVLQRRSSRGE